MSSIIFCKNPVFATAEDVELFFQEWPYPAKQLDECKEYLAQGWTPIVIESVGHPWFMPGRENYLSDFTNEGVGKFRVDVKILRDYWLEQNKKST